MVIYGIWLAVVIVLYGLLRRLPLANKSRWYPLTVSLMLTAILGLRHPSMGVDLGYGMTHGYLPSFYILNGSSWKEILTMPEFQNYERGFLVFTKLTGSLWMEQQWFLLCCAGVSVLPVGAVIGTFSRNQRLSFLIYFGLTAFQIPFSGLRQAMALGISFLGMFYIPQRRWKSFLAVVGLAALFHDTAVTALLMYPLYWWKPDKQLRLVSFLVLAAMFALRAPLWNGIVAILDRGSPAVHSGDVGLFLLFCGIYGYMVLFSPEREGCSGLVNMQWLCCCVLAFTEVSTVAARVGYYSMLYLTLSLPEILEDIRCRLGNREYLLHTGAVAVGFLLLGVYNLLHADWARAVPYGFFWEAM